MALHLVCYDIRNVDRLREVHQLCKRRALAVQHSVYLVTDELQRDRLLALMATITKPEDDVRSYALKSQPQWHVLGSDVMPGPNLTLCF